MLSCAQGCNRSGYGPQLLQLYHYTRICYHETRKVQLPHNAAQRIVTVFALRTSSNIACKTKLTRGPLIYGPLLLSLLQGLAEIGPCTSKALAEHLALNERYVREWLYHQAAARFVAANEHANEFWLTQAQREAFVDEGEALTAAPLATSRDIFVCV